MYHHFVLDIRTLGHTDGYGSKSIHNVDSNHLSNHFHASLSRGGNIASMRAKSQYLIYTPYKIRIVPRV